MPEEEFSEHNNDSNYKSSARKAVVELCLEALGHWATDGNRERLRRDSQTLFDFMSLTYDLETDILPVLRKMVASDPSIPLIRSWEFFTPAIVEAADLRSEKVNPAIASTGKDMVSMPLEAERPKCEPERQELGSLFESPLHETARKGWS